MSSIKRSEVSNLKMAAGNEKKYTKIIINGILNEWVGIGWVALREATAIEKKKYPEVV
jgi:hypothetical protein